MFKINKDKSMEIIRGDSGVFQVNTKRDGELLKLSGGDHLYFTVKTDTHASNYEIQKVLTSEETSKMDGKNVFNILPEDTSKMEYGTYKYDIQLVLEDGYTDTIVSPKDFKITDEVSF